jgi:hypothetical protein
MIRSLIEQYKLSHIFWRHLGQGELNQPCADTRFWYTSREFAENYLIPAYFMGDDTSIPCEYPIFDMLNQTMQPGKFLRPSLSGFEGGTNEQYFDLSLGALDINCPCWVMGA